ncbi:hypothetical protein ACQY0O_003775 [Thecaphora frezii]
MTSPAASSLRSSGVSSLLSRSTSCPSMPAPIGTPWSSWCFGSVWVSSDDATAAALSLVAMSEASDVV